MCVCFTYSISLPEDTLYGNLCQAHALDGGTAELHVHVLMRDERRKEERSKQGQTDNKAKQHSTPKAVTFPKKNELPQVGLEPTTLYMYIHVGVLLGIVVTIPSLPSFLPTPPPIPVFLYSLVPVC